MKRFFSQCLSLAAALFLSAGAMAEAGLDIPSGVTLFKNVKVFNGTEDKLHDVDVLVVKNCLASDGTGIFSVWL